MSGGEINLDAALAEFVAACTENPRLREMNRDWSRVIQVVSSDGPEPYWIACDHGILSWGKGERPWDLRIDASGEILSAVFTGQLSPTEPYDVGDLMVKGQQDDLMRLDIMTLLIWGE